MNRWTPEGITILVAEQNDRVREALHEFVAAAFPRCHVIEAHLDGEAAVVAKSRSPELIIVDVSALANAGLDTIGALRAAAPEARILALTREDEEGFRESARAAGASMCLSIWQLRERLPGAVKALLAPGTERRLRKTVVCVEDDAEMIDLIKFILRRHNFHTVGNLGGHQAMDTIRRVKPDVVLLDLMMPDISGWDVYQQMKADEHTKDIPVIVVTVLKPHWSKKRGLAPEDVEGYLVKPFLPRSLVNEVRRTVGRAVA